jgi:hypothetical protein
MPARSVLRAGAGAPYLVLFQRINLDFLKKDQHFSACLQQVSRAKRKGPPCCSDMQYWPPACTSGAIHFQFDRFSSLMLAMNGLFLSLFAHTFSRYWQRVVVGKAGERVVQRTLAELGLESIHDIYLPTHDGSRQLDHIALFPGSLAVIETKTYNGRLIMDGSNHWHRIGRRGACYRINNPLWQLDAARKALCETLPGARVWGLVVLAGKHTATNGYPDHVMSVDAFRNYVIEYHRRHPERRYADQISEAWKRLNALENEYARLGKTHVREARRKRGDRFYDFEEVWPLWLWGSLAAQFGILCVLARYQVI